MSSGHFASTFERGEASGAAISARPSDQIAVGRCRIRSARRHLVFSIQ